MIQRMQLNLRKVKNRCAVCLDDKPHSCNLHICFCIANNSSILLLKLSHKKAFQLKNISYQKFSAFQIKNFPNLVDYGLCVKNFLSLILPNRPLLPHMLLKMLQYIPTLHLCRFCLVRKKV